MAIGRIKKPAANTPAVFSNCTVGLLLGKKGAGKVERTEGLDVKVKPLHQIA